MSDGRVEDAFSRNFGTGKIRISRLMLDSDGYSQLARGRLSVGGHAREFDTRIKWRVFLCLSKSVAMFPAEQESTNER